ncbi:MAG TPA: hypothetical protein VF855_09205 [Acidimicrobiales bacterium]
MSGHAGEHLASATAPFMAGAVLFILFRATPQALKQLDALAAAALWLATVVLVMVFPPWIIPGAGAGVLTIVRCVARGKRAWREDAARQQGLRPARTLRR